MSCNTEQVVRALVEQYMNTLTLLPVRLIALIVGTSTRSMKYLTHLVLFQLSREGKPEAAREARDSFGLDSASCWCAFALATSPPASSHAKSAPPASQPHQHITVTENIELHFLSPSGRARDTQTPVTCEEPPLRWLLPPPMAHLRPQSLNSSSSNNPSSNPHSNRHQISPRSR